MFKKFSEIRKKSYKDKLRISVSHKYFWKISRFLIYISEPVEILRNFQVISTNCLKCILDEAIGTICASIEKFHRYSFTSGLSPWCQWTIYVNEITLDVEFFLVIDFLPVKKYSHNRWESYFGLVLCVCSWKFYVIQNRCCWHLERPYSSSGQSVIYGYFHFLYVITRNSTGWLSVYVNPTVLQNLRHGVPY